jgi:hypothetical protein
LTLRAFPNTFIGNEFTSSDDREGSPPTHPTLNRHNAIMSSSSPPRPRHKANANSKSREKSDSHCSQDVAGKPNSKAKKKDLPTTPLTNENQPEQPVLKDSNVYMPYDTDSESENEDDGDSDDDSIDLCYVEWAPSDDDFPDTPDDTEGEAHTEKEGKSSHKEKGKSRNQEKSKSRKKKRGKVGNEKAAKARDEERGRSS